MNAVTREYRRGGKGRQAHFELERLNGDANAVEAMMRTPGWKILADRAALARERLVNQLPTLDEPRDIAKAIGQINGLGIVLDYGQALIQLRQEREAIEVAKADRANEQAAMAGSETGG